MALDSGVYIVGAGRVGLGLALALRQRGVFVSGVYAHSRVSHDRTRQLLSLDADAALGASACSRAELVLVTVPDRTIAGVGRELAQRGALKPGSVLAHTSGYAAASELGAPADVLLASVHPLVACMSPEQAANALVGAAFAFEGDEAARPVIAELVSVLGGRLLAATALDKPRYHAALVLASNLLVALMRVAQHEAEGAGLTDSEAFFELARGALDLAREHGPNAALTGPLVRGDLDSVAGHLAHLSPRALPAYRALSLQALEMAEARGLSPDLIEGLRRLLAG